MKNMFKKRYLHSLGDFARFSGKIKELREKTKHNKDEDTISQAFAEKIMLAVTGVNNCVYCSYRHTKTALRQGVTTDEIRDLLNGEFGNVPEDERVAMLYAQHWTESMGEPDEAARKKMIEYYGTAKTEYIELQLHYINIGNLISNTVEAYKRKIRPEKGGFRFFLVYLLCAPIAFFIRNDGRKHAGFFTGKVSWLH